MHEELHDIKEDVKEIKGHLITIISKQEVHNHILDEHQKRSTALEEAFKPVQRHVHYVEGALKLFGIASVLLGIILTAKSLFL